MIGKLLANLFGRTAAPPSAAAPPQFPPQSPPPHGGPTPDEAVQLLVKVRANLHNQATLLSQLLTENLLARPELADPRRLERHGWKAYSQGDEDGMLAEIFRRIGAPHRSFVEFGCGNGMENNSLYLLSQGWRGLWMDGDPVNTDYVRRGYGYLMQHGLLQHTEALIDAENIDGLIAAARLGPEIDLLSVDIDGNDARVWQAIRCVSARVVAIEYNAKFRPPHDYTRTYDPRGEWDRTDRFGSSLTHLTNLGATLGYQLVGCSLTGGNAFFVRRDLAGDLFAQPATAEHLYQPARYVMTHYISGGHQSNSLTVVESAARMAGLPWPPDRPFTGLTIDGII